MPERIYKSSKLEFLILILILFVISSFAVPAGRQGFRSFALAAALVNINTAGVEELDTLDGIGPAYAQRIIDYRELNGPFKNKEEIKNVSGIGEVTFSKIKDDITVGESADSEGEDKGVADAPASVHYQSGPLSAAAPTEKKINLSAGRDRLGSVGSPLEFRAETNLEYPNKSVFKWSFGDGSIGAGDVIVHTYEYPGEYAVVLVAADYEREAVSRIKVNIVEAELNIISASPERIEIKNNSKYEINLYGRALESDKKIFLFPQNTIVGPGQSISFGSRVTGLAPAGILGVNILEVGEEAQVHKILEKREKEKLQKITSIQNRIAALQAQAASMAVATAAQVASRENQLDSEEEKMPPAAQAEQVANAASAKKTKAGWFEIIKKFLLRNNNKEGK